MPYAVDRKPLTLSERLYFPQIFAGLRVTLKHLFAPNVTMEYPEQRPAIPAGYRGVPTLVMDPNGREKCVSCQLCEFVCPPKAIRITPGEIPHDDPTAHVEKAPKEFEIDMLRCIYCGMCEEACQADEREQEAQGGVNGILAHHHPEGRGDGENRKEGE